MQLTYVLVLSSVLILQNCFAQDPIQNYIVKNEIKDRIAHDERIKERLEDRKAHDYRVLNQIAYDTAYRGGPAYGDATLQANLQSRIASDVQSEALLNDRIAYDKRLLSGTQSAYAYPYYQQGYYQGYYPQYYTQPAVQPVVAPVAPVTRVVSPPVVTKVPVVNQYSQYSGVQVPIISYENDINPDGSYKYSYSTGNGIAASEEGVARSNGKDLEAVNFAQGNFAYTSPEGVPVSVSYTADENGFHAKTFISTTGAEKYKTYTPQVQVVPAVTSQLVQVPVASPVPSSALDINPKLGRPLFSEIKTP